MDASKLSARYDFLICLPKNDDDGDDDDDEAEE